MKFQICRTLIYLLTLLCLSSAFSLALGQRIKHSVANAHSHNDYNHAKPFYTAYDSGFGSIEADIFLRNGHLYVAHDFADIDTARTLAALYLEPLREKIVKNNGHVYPDALKKLQLLIDLKTAALPTLDTLISVLRKYNEIIECPTLKIVISGNQPDHSRLNAYPRWIHFDGRPGKIPAPEVLDRIALISDNFRKYSSWTGEGTLPRPDLKKIKLVVAEAHKYKKPIRFWATPDSPDAWRLLKKLKVDYINTDKIGELSDFLNLYK
ncbi:MAG TPA: phosphatidylinositol-specific phospholipase C/glycerophosphodiester phosphodiesterase family protein [Chitinophagaceae bacterium]